MPSITTKTLDTSGLRGPDNGAKAAIRRPGRRDTHEQIPLLRLSDCALRLQVTEQTVRTLITEGKLRARRVGREWRVKPEWLEAYIDGDDRPRRGGR